MFAIRPQFPKKNVFLVGGAVRNELLGQPVLERDWVVIGMNPDQMLAMGFRQVGAQFPVFLHPETREEYALARKEKKLGPGHSNFICDFAETVTLEEDLGRRDLTINAIAKDEFGVLIDPWGGIRDLQTREFRHVSAAFSEDPLRILRVARFRTTRWGDGFSIHPETLSLMSEMSQSGELAFLTPERVWQETSKALMNPFPANYFACLHHCSALSTIDPPLESFFSSHGSEAFALFETVADTFPNLTLRFGLLYYCLRLAYPSPKAGMKLPERLAMSLHRCPIRQLREFAKMAFLTTTPIVTPQPESWLPLALGWMSEWDAWRRPQPIRDYLTLLAHPALQASPYRSSLTPSIEHIHQLRDVLEIGKAVTLSEHELTLIAPQQRRDYLQNKRIERALTALKVPNNPQPQK